MQNNKFLYLLLGGFGIVLLLLFTLFSDSEAKKWRETYHEDEKNPYDLHIFHEVLQTYFPNNTAQKISSNVATDLPANPTKQSNYVFVGQEPYFDSVDIVRISAFVRNGNTAFISAKEIPNQLIDSIKNEYYKPIITQKNKNKAKPIEFDDDGEIISSDNDEEEENDRAYADEKPKKKQNKPAYIDTIPTLTEEQMDSTQAEFIANSHSLYNYRDRDSTALLNFNYPNLHTPNGYRYTFKYKNKGADYGWTDLNTDIFLKRKNTVQVLGYTDSLTNFIRVSHGKGYFLLHSTPIAFTNLYMTETEGKDYMQGALSYLATGNIYWDEPAKTYRPEDNKYNRRQSNMNLGHKGPLDYILSQPALRWAWYTFLATILLYFVFRTKRRQRVIPVLVPNLNTSLEYIQSMGRLYFIQRDHKNIAEHKMHIFQNALREKYSLPIHLPAEQLVPRIVQKTEVPENIVREIYTWYAFISNNTEISEDNLLRFHESIHTFNMVCR